MYPYSSSYLNPTFSLPAAPHDTLTPSAPDLPLPVGNRRPQHHLQRPTSRMGLACLSLIIQTKDRAHGYARESAMLLVQRASDQCLGWEVVCPDEEVGSDVYTTELRENVGFVGAVMRAKAKKTYYESTTAHYRKSERSPRQRQTNVTYQISPSPQSQCPGNYQASAPPPKKAFLNIPESSSPDKLQLHDWSWCFSRTEWEFCSSD
ncbi:hypothetical protein T440DRAFT_477548 [Plenodomus tracheiphilus IPT5]|uniref:Uncharacterized protein n=1 Tax=Plenodomus tracheiphilus IPT5 TaxID=1408161 RepID=A0A6A7BAR1_9PLEO|nr:hypothetical protein T440DRAFT_477548 [Plenodomus tracheiphilus IPT5]